MRQINVIRRLEDYRLQITEIVGQIFIFAKSVVSELARKNVGQRFIFAKCNLKRLPYEKNVIESKFSHYILPSSHPTIQPSYHLIRGYTLIELMVIISIIFILTAMAIPSFESIRDKAAIHKAKGAMQHLRVAQKLYQQNHSLMYYADSTDDLIIYTSITNILRNFDGEPTSLSINVLNEEEGKGYTITASAKDSNKTPVTATESTVYPK
jgi:type II secretory pathway pseudopilin PulG